MKLTGKIRSFTFKSVLKLLKHGDALILDVNVIMKSRLEHSLAEEQVSFPQRVLEESARDS